MPISIKCPGCGRTFQAPENLAGKRAKCPKCSTVIQVGAAPPQPPGQVTSEHVASGADSAEPIPVTCSCGKRLRAKAELAGRQVKCPACGQALAIPTLPPAATAPIDELDFDRLMAAETTAGSLPRGPLGPPKKKTDGPNMRLIVGLIAATGAVVLVLVLVMFLWPSGDNVELASQGTTPGVQPSDTGEVAPSPPPPPAPGKVAAARTYPSFPDALTEVPPWNDANPPFDLADFLKAPPDEENAAPLYLDALFEFEDLSCCYVPRGLKWSEYPDEVRRRVEIALQRSKECNRIEDAWEKDPKSVDMTAVDAWLAQYDVGFEKLAAAQRRPRCVFQTGLSLDSLLPHVQAARQVARVVKWRTRRDLQRGDFERPMQGLNTVLRLSRDLQPRGDLVCQLVSIAVDGICCQDMVPAILTAPAVETRHCDRLLALLTEHEAESIDAFVEGNRAEYVYYRQALHDLQHRTGSFDPQTMKDIWGIQGDVTSPLACIRIFTDLGGNSPQELATVAARFKGALLPGAWQGGKMLSDEDYAREVEALNRFCATMLALAEQPDFRRQENAAIKAAESLINETTLARFLIPAENAVMEAIRRNEAHLRGTQCLVALRRWQLEHGGLPEDLDTLVKDAGMPGVPTDPFSGKPLRMIVIDGSPVIYSVGPDGKDDHGREKDTGPGGQKSQGDIVFRLEPPP